MKTPTNIIGQRLEREFAIDRATVNADSRTVAIAWSSEAPVERGWGIEILDHSLLAVRLQRLTDGAPLLLQHDPDRQIGVIESASIGADKVGRALVRFSRSALGEEILQDITDGIRSKVSVGYIIHDIERVPNDERGDVYRVTAWEPLELSIVSIPADNSVGVGRAIQQPEVSDMPEIQAETPVERDPVEPTETTETAETRAVETPVNPESAQIRAVGAHFGHRDLAEDHIMLGGSLAEFRARLKKDAQPDPVPSAARVEARIPHAGNLRAFRPESYAGGRREAEESAYRAGQWCRATVFGDQEAARWCRDYGVRVMTGLGAGQSVIVPDELVLPIIKLREQYGLARRLCRVHPMASDTASIPRLTAGATAYFVGRESAPSQSNPAFDNITLTARNVAAETRISNDYADDSAINLADMIAEEHARAFAIKEDSCLINGDGASTYGGIVGLRAAILGLAGAVDAATNHDTFAEIDAADLRKVTAALPDIPGIMPVWLTSKPGQNLLFGRLTDAASGNNKRDLSAKMPDQWAGYDILTSPEMPKVATDLSDVAMVLFGDFRMGVVLGDRRGMTMMVDPYSLSSYQQVKIISSERFDINCHGVGTAGAAGPIVALIGE